MRQSARVLLQSSLLVASVAASCSWPGSPARPKLNPPTPAPTPSQNVTRMTGQDPDEIVEAFEELTQDTVDQAHLLASSSCDQLAAIASERPDDVVSLRAYAQTLKSLAARDQLLSRPRGKLAVELLENALARLDQALAACHVSLR